MTVRVLLFAQYRDLAGSDTLDLEVRDGATVAEVLGRLREHSPELARLSVSAAIAVNRAVAPLTATVRAGDEVALLPPVAGG